MLRFLLIAAGAALGANSRYLVSVWAAGRFGVGFPFGTLIVNVTGSLLLGFLLSLTADRLLSSSEMRLFLTVGFLGSYTTFSTYAFESLVLIRSGNVVLGILYITANTLIGLAFALAGIWLARLVA